MILCFLLVPSIVGATFLEAFDSTSGGPVFPTEVVEDNDWMAGLSLINVTTAYPEVLFSLGEEEGWIPREELFAAAYQEPTTSTIIPQDFSYYRRQGRRPRGSMGKSESRVSVTQFLKPPYH